MTVRCTICKRVIVQDEGRFNLPSGVECQECGSRSKKKPKFTKIAGYKIPTKMLDEYVTKVEFTRQSAKMGKEMNNPIIVTQALQARVEIHKRIFNITGHDHEDMGKEATKIRKALEEWLEKNVLIGPDKGGLI